MEFHCKSGEGELRTWIVENWQQQEAMREGLLWQFKVEIPRACEALRRTTTGAGQDYGENHWHRRTASKGGPSRSCRENDGMSRVS